MDETHNRYVAVYGTLRKSLCNHFVLQDSKYVGEFKSEQKFIMINFPKLFYPNITPENSLSKSKKKKLIENGITPTPVIFEVYEVSSKIWEDLCELEGYNGNNDNQDNLYLMLETETPFGKACYFSMKNFVDGEYVKNGDYTEFMKNNEGVLNN